MPGPKKIAIRTGWWCEKRRFDCKLDLAINVYLWIICIDIPYTAKCVSSDHFKSFLNIVNTVEYANILCQKLVVVILF